MGVVCSNTGLEKTIMNIGDWGNIKRLLAMSLFVVGIASAPVAHADVPCVTPPAGAPLTTSQECHDCIMAHLFDRDGALRDCLGQGLTTPPQN
jgi:hypothetical protein